ncbi:hypothetical protein BDR05DRAFT_994532 [Suillus weaverae]|nr:hypothetical protein BDR05DRAFT_994532 [Suillus weaverae]
MALVAKTSDKSKESSRTDKKKKPGNCNYCKKPADKAKSSDKEKDDEKDKSKAELSVKVVHVVEDDTPSLQLFVAHESKHESHPAEWIVDSGASATKLHPSRELPPRDKKGRFIKKTSINPELSDSSFPSSDSSPLDTPEIDHRALEQEHEESEHEVIRQLADNDQDDDEESLPGAPDPSTIVFPSFQPHKPIPTITLSAAPNKPANIMTGVPLPALFHGKENENAQNFLRSTEAYFLVNQIADEAIKVALFAALISAGSQADHWWTNLDAQHKTTWTAVRTAFETKWLAIAVAGKTQLEYQRELLALWLKDEDVGERITLAKITTWSHIHFHNQLKTLVQDAGVANAPVLIHQVRDALPRVLRDLTTPAPPDWNTFLTEIANVNVDILQDKAKRAKERKEAERMQNAYHLLRKPPE